MCATGGVWSRPALSGSPVNLMVDHIENIHHFKEGRGYSFYECLREYGLEWFGSRAFFGKKKATGQSLWMDLARARRSGQELRNSYTITGSPDFAPLRRFFKAAVDQLQLLYDDMPVQDFATSMTPVRSLIDCMKDEIYQSAASLDNTLTRRSPVEELVVEELPVDIPPSMSMCHDTVSSVPDVVPIRSLTPANRSLRFLETGAPGSPLTYELALRAAVPGMCIASTNLLSFIDPLPMDRLALYDLHTVCEWPAEDRTQLLAVAHRDLHVARRNIANLMRYVDDQAAHLAVCAGAGEDTSMPYSTVPNNRRLRHFTPAREAYISQDRALIILELYAWVPGYIISRLQPGSLRTLPEPSTYNIRTVCLCARFI